jgi:lipopolysaccharide/colanic/teichoic acid biosynthesis glycosyltransferase
METVRLLLLSLAVWLLPRKERRRYSQEWFDYLCDPETAHKTRQALGFVFAAIRMDLLLLRRPANAFGKRALDVSFSVFGLIFLAPLLVLCALAVLISGPGPLIVQPKRIGLHGKQFSAFLLRAMHVDDPGAPDLARPLANERQVTRVGRVLRRYSIDELPQLWNVLKGDMSLVGPRADVRGMMAVGLPYDQVAPHYSRRYSVRPGLSGLAQVHGFRGPLHSRKLARMRLALDLKYARNPSLWLDIKIIVLTVMYPLFAARNESGERRKRRGRQRRPR